MCLLNTLNEAEVAADLTEIHKAAMARLAPFRWVTSGFRRARCAARC